MDTDLYLTIVEQSKARAKRPAAKHQLCRRAMDEWELVTSEVDFFRASFDD